MYLASQLLLVVKNLPANAGDKTDTGSILGLGRSSGIGNGAPLQYFCLENFMDRGTWWATVHGVMKSQTRLSMCAHMIVKNEGVCFLKSVAIKWAVDKLLKISWIARAYVENRAGSLVMSQLLNIYIKKKECILSCHVLSLPWKTETFKYASSTRHRQTL